jgi:hypothetical protein
MVYYASKVLHVLDLLRTELYAAHCQEPIVQLGYPVQMGYIALWDISVLVVLQMPCLAKLKRGLTAQLGQLIQLAWCVQNSFGVLAVYRTRNPVKHQQAITVLWGQNLRMVCRVQLDTSVSEEHQTKPHALPLKAATVQMDLTKRKVSFALQAVHVQVEQFERDSTEMMDIKVF